MSTAQTIRALLEAHVEPPLDDARELDLASFVVVVLAEALEERFEFQVKATELVPENFSSIARLAAYVDRKVAERGAP